MKVNLLTELRYVAKEVGSLAEARAMPTEVRRWWIDQIVKENEERREAMEGAGGRRTDVR